MKSNEIKTTKTISAPRETVFKYFTQPEFIEQWAYPEGMTLKVPKFEAKVDGRYRYEHSSKDGQFLCEGKITELVPNERLVQVDEYINGPDGKRLGENLVNTIDFKDTVGGTEVTAVTRGNFDEEFMQECEAGWSQSFDHLNDLVAKEVGAGVKGRGGEARPNL